VVEGETILLLNSSRGGGRCLRPSPFNILSMDDEHERGVVVVAFLTVERSSAVEEEPFLSSKNDSDNDEGGENKSLLLE